MRDDLDDAADAMFARWADQLGPDPDPGLFPRWRDTLPFLAGAMLLNAALAWVLYAAVPPVWAALNATDHPVTHLEAQP